MKTHFRLKNLGKDKIYTLKQAHAVLGRNTYCDIHIDSGLLSRQHAEIRVTHDQVILEDLGSTNGTYVNNMRIDVPTTLMHGDVITVGHDKLMLIAPDKHDGSTVFTYNMSDDSVETDDDVAVASTRLQKAFPTPLAWSGLSSNVGVDEQEINQLIRKALYGTHYDAHITPALLIVSRGSEQGKVYELAYGGDNRSSNTRCEWLVGRGRNADVIIDHPTVSNVHATIAVQDDQWHIVDRQSTNGLKLNRKRVIEAGCQNGDVLTLGNLDVVLNIL